MKNNYQTPKAEKIEFDYTNVVVASSVGEDTTAQSQTVSKTSTVPSVAKTRNGSGRGNNRAGSNGCCVY